MRAARIAVKKGYKNVYAFIGGIPEWRKFNYPMTIDKEWQNIKVKKIPPKRFKKLLEEEEPYILDVRPLNFQRDATFIMGSFLCPLVLLSDKYKEIPKDQRIVITDWAMKQSPTAAKYLISKGYQVIGVLKGGIERWKKEKLPVEKRTPTKKIGSLIPPKNK